MRRAVIETPVAHPTVIARSLRPDHTDDMTSQVIDETVRTEIRRPATSSLQSTADDYVVNLTVATRIDALVDDRFTTESDTTDHPRSDNQ